jgi:hypothetical protein
MKPARTLATIDTGERVRVRQAGTDFSLLLILTHEGHGAKPWQIARVCNGVAERAWTFGRKRDAEAWLERSGYLEDGRGGYYRACLPLGWR